MNLDSGMLRTILATAGVLLCHFVTLSMLLAVFCVAVPEFIKSFKGVDAELPANAILLLNLIDWVVSFRYLLFLLLIPDVAVYFVLYRLPASANWLAACWATGLVMLGMLLLTWTIFTMLVPPTGLLKMR